MSAFVGELLTPPELRFNYSSNSAKDMNPRRGLKIYGPYDSGLLGKDRIKAAVIFPSEHVKEKDKLVKGLLEGYDSFMGFKALFRIPLTFEREVPVSTGKDVGRAVWDLASRNDTDLVFIIIDPVHKYLYQTLKQELLGNGIPNQVVTVEKLQDKRQLPWVLENLALACYAKIGGSPWVVASEENRHELVIGISRAQDKNKKFVVGFVTLFTQEGDFILLYSSAPVEWDREKYVRGLTQLIVEAYEEYRQIQGEPEAIVLHLCKRPGKLREVKAVQQAIQEIDPSIPYALVHLNDDSSYRLFDTGHATYIPQAGLKVNLGSRNALLLLDGRIGDRRRSRGVPKVLDIRMDKRSTMPVDEFPYLIRQIYNFSRVNWRGFNARAVPVTLNYSYLIARLIMEIGSENWNRIISKGRLRDKAWFL